MTIPVEHAKQLGLKTPFFLALDAVGNAATAAQLRAIRKELAAGVPLLEIYNQFRPSKRISGLDAKELAHISTHWLGGAWWPNAKTERTMRDGIIEVIGLQLQKRRPRKVDYWWVRGADGLRVVPCVDDDRIVVVVLTPATPAGASRRPARRS
jgi:hypothetical protein